MEEAPDRKVTLFNLRYAVRVLERHARFYSRVDGLLRIAAFVSGSAALATVTDNHAAITSTLGLGFVILQAIDLALGPASKVSNARIKRAEYARVVAEQGRCDDAAFAAAYEAAVATDDITVFESMRALAYNDVVEEMGFDMTHSYPVGLCRRAAMLFA